MHTNMNDLDRSNFDKPQVRITRPCGFARHGLQNALLLGLYILIYDKSHGCH